MAQSYLIFDFGTNEEAAQQARHRLEGWKQAFRLDKKLLLKFERTESEPAAAKSSEDAPKAAQAKSEKVKGDKGKATKGKGASAKAAEVAAEKSPEEATNNQKVRLIVRLDFSDHEKLSHHRWLERIPIEEPFKNAQPRVIRQGEAEFDGTAELFESLE